MAVIDFFASEIVTELLKTMIAISRKSWLSKGNADNLISFVQELLPIIQEIKYSDVELPAIRQSQLDRFFELLK
ncbi:hypothetical protein GBA52_001864 [Prunus armeniaca]|nr:hypothetical protein GBA52_001864 [Prunus armeniaca]